MRYFVYIFLCLNFAYCATSNDLKKGEDLYLQGIEKYKNGNNDDAMELFEEACSYGDGQICNLVGRHFAQNFKFDEAVNFYEKGCEKNDLDSCNNLGMMYKRGKGVWKSKSKAIKLFRKSCTATFLTPCANLAIEYIDGEDIGMDMGIVKERIEKDCKNGNAESCFALALMYDYGKGVATNHSKAAKLYQKALNSSVGDFSKYFLGFLYLNGMGVKKNTNKAKQLYKDVDWLMINYIYKISIQNDGMVFFAKDYDRLEGYFGTLCDNGSSRECFDLGMISKNSEKNFKAFEYFEKSCKLGNSNGCLQLAKMYTDGIGVKQNTTEAKRIYGELCDKKNEEGCKQYKKLNNPSWWDKIF